MKFDVYYPDGDFKCQVDTYEEAEIESRNFVSKDIRVVPETKFEEEILKIKF